MNIVFHTSIFLLCDFYRQYHPQLVAAHHNLNTNLVVQLLIATEQKLHVIFEPKQSPTGRILYSLIHQIIQVHMGYDEYLVDSIMSTEIWAQVLAYFSLINNFQLFTGLCLKPKDLI